MPPENRSAPARMSGGILLLAAILPAALAGGYLGAEFATRPLHEAIATRPPVLIVDVAAALDGIVPEDVGEAIADLRSTAKRLADGGVLVLDAQAVLAAPQDAYVLSGKQP
ncbi:hypothetical protein [Thiocapsa roseopersicina]|uniref:Uncharacterized protein n=1 Tax=Thiocapsa roseopersicina TaxID=1058 RepID=A0A1H3DTE8_THIRO|nr:hypothetical protein [Thiocapsa roseopersicina]SDX69617.1 hypothetical protein SAMN05421783_1595 [Thiocapsa roseopersicina]